MNRVNYRHYEGAAGRLFQGIAADRYVDPLTKKIKTAWKNFTQKGEMPKSIKRKPNRGNKVNKKSQGTKQWTVTRQAPSAGRAMAAASSSNVVAGASRKRGRSVKKEAIKKKVKVSKKFKKKVAEALEGERGTGYLVERTVSNIQIPVDNKQAVFQPYGGRTIDGVSYPFFNPSHVNYVASVLWKKKVQSLSTGSFDPDMFYIKNLKIEVCSQYYIHKLKNNTARTMEIRIYDVSPKMTQEINSSNVNFYTALDHWIQAFAIGSPSGGAGTITQTSNENPGNTQYNTIGAKPSESLTFRSQYSCDETIIKLEPGKEYYHKVQGPSNYTYDYNKFWKQDNFRPIQKFCKTSLICFNTDLTATDLSNVGRYTDILPNQGFGLLCETEVYTKVRCPNKSGFVTPAGALGAGVVQELGQTGYCFIRKNWYGEQGGAIQMVTDENPQATVVNGV